MKRGKIFWVVLGLIIVLSMMLSACAEEETPTPTATAPAPTATAPAPTATAPAPTATAPAPTATAPAPTATQANWWDKWGEPEYGGTMVFRVTTLVDDFDPCSMMPSNAHHYWYEHLFMHDWTLDRKIWSFKTGWVPSEYYIGHLVESWEWVDAQTLITHIRHGIHWQDKAPANGREFTAYDVQHHYDRVFGTGSGYTVPHPILSLWGASIKKATAIDDYTVNFTFKNPTPVFNMLTIVDIPTLNVIECPEVLEAGIKDWKNACGTGAYMPTDFTADTSLTMSKNPNYWGYDERHPQNRLPYADEVKLMCIPDISTAIAALRTGRIDWITDISWQQSQSLKRTSPELEQTTKPIAAYVVNCRCDTKPFTDINVRKALQLAIDRQTIAKSFYGGTVDGKPAGLITPEHKGWCIPYDEWSQDLKDEYSYNPTKAKQLLAEAGYPNGFKTNIVAQSTMDLELLQIIKAQFMDIGVDMDITVMDPVSYMSFIGARKHDQMSYANWSAKPDPPHIRISDLTTSQRLNGTCNNDAVYEEMYHKLLTATTTEEAKQMVIDADQYVLRQHWGAVVCPITSFVAWQPYLKGYSGEDVGWAWTREWNFPRLWVDQALKKSMGR
jgi:peptide/nickel transport system substrate-binding protein